MKFLLLCSEKNDKMLSFLRQKGDVKYLNDKVSVNEISSYDWIISYGYRHIITEKILNASKNPIINLHISYLPYNRGAHPNYWSFKENTLKGVTIHFIDSGIDTGPILVQKKCQFNRDDTLKTSYQKLKIEIEELFYLYFDKIVNHEISPIPQNKKGTFHKKSDLPADIDWNMNVNDINNDRF